MHSRHRASNATSSSSTVVRMLLIFMSLFFFSPPLFTFLSLLYIQPRYLPPQSSHRFCANTTGCKRVRTFSLSCQRPSTHPFRERAAPTPLPGAKEFHSLILSFRHAEVPSPSTTTTITTNTTSDLPVREGHAHSSPPTPTPHLPLLFLSLPLHHTSVTVIRECVRWRRALCWC